MTYDTRPHHTFSSSELSTWIPNLNGTHSILISHISLSLSHQNLIFSPWWQDSLAVGTTPQDLLWGDTNYDVHDSDDSDDDDDVDDGDDT